eukprot:2921301-Amphidinium_carterae.2
MAHAVAWCLPLGTVASDELALLRFCDKAFRDQRPVADGEKLLAAYFHRNPQHGRKAGVRMPRMARTLVSWSRLRPTETKVAPPHVVVLSIAQRLVELGKHVMALG